MIKTITAREVEFVSHRLAQEILSFNEPIPDYSTRYPGRLESCLAAPFQTFRKKQLYSSLASQASVLLYLLIKNHPFQNGNKRVAITTLMVFLHWNRKKLVVDTYELYKITIWVAESPAKAKAQMIAFLEEYIRNNTANA